MIREYLKDLLVEYAIGITATIVLVIGLFLAMDYAFSLPTVVESYNGGHCEEVFNYPGIVFNTESNYSCENLPAKFNHVWAE